MTKSRGIIAKRKIWTEEENSLLTHLYANTYSPTLAIFFNCALHVLYKNAYKLGLKKSSWYQVSPLSQRLKRGDDIGKAYRYPKGHIPANKGKKGYCNPGSIPTQFKPKHIPANYKPVGSTRIDNKDGYILMKMAEGINQWRPIHRIIYERMHGPIPQGFMAAFVNGNKTNISITNLTTISQKENALRNSVHKYGPEIADLYRLKARVTRQIKKRQKEQK